MPASCFATGDIVEIINPLDIERHTLSTINKGKVATCVSYFWKSDYTAAIWIRVFHGQLHYLGLTQSLD
jgi:hypothetical protein